MLLRYIPNISIRILFSFAPLVSWAQFNSGSTGSDGALAFPTAQAGQTIVFDPNSFSPPLDPQHDNIFNFTTITIPKNVTVKLVPSTLAAGPVVWLATGAVDIEGTLDLSGADGHPAKNPPIQSLRMPAEPGPGGYPGGVGGNSGNGATLTAEVGSGPGGGLTNAQFSGGGGCAQGGSFTGNSYLVPLLGGSGGGGFGLNVVPPGFGAGGGGGGGALLIASSTSIGVNGAILANGGATGVGNLAGGGSGGAIRLMANLITGTGNLQTKGGSQDGNPCTHFGGNGTIRLEAVQQQYVGGLIGNVASGTPFNTFLPSAPTAIRVTSIGGVPVAPLPTGSFQMPDVTINASGPVTVAISASNVPLGTIVNLQFNSENGPDIIVASTPLTGSLASSTATAQVTLPSGFSRGFVFASF